MTQTVLATLVIVGAVGGALGFTATTTGAADAGMTAPQFRVDCWIDAKFGDQPGQLVRGWICERPYRPADADQQSATSVPQPPSAEKEDVATIGSGGARH